MLLLCVVCGSMLLHILYCPRCGIFTQCVCHCYICVCLCPAVICLSFFQLSPACVSFFSCHLHVCLFQLSSASASSFHLSSCHLPLYLAVTCLCVCVQLSPAFESSCHLPVCLCPAVTCLCVCVQLSPACAVHWPGVRADQQCQAGGALLHFGPEHSA